MRVSKCIKLSGAIIIYRLRTRVKVNCQAVLKVLTRTGVNTIESDKSIVKKTK
jgi:hypothetical protein